MGGNLGVESLLAACEGAERVRDWSQEELAEKVSAAGAHQISRYENGQTTPSTETAIKLAEVFDVSLDYLLIEGTARRALHNGD